MATNLKNFFLQPFLLLGMSSQEPCGVGQGIGGGVEASQQKDKTLGDYFLPGQVAGDLEKGDSVELEEKIVLGRDYCNSGVLLPLFDYFPFPGLLYLDIRL